MLKKNFPVWTALEASAELKAQKEAIKNGPRYQVVVVPPYYHAGSEYFQGQTWFVVDCANDKKVVGSSRDDSGVTSAYYLASVLNERDQIECDRLNDLKVAFHDAMNS